MDWNDPAISTPSPVTMATFQVQMVEGSHLIFNGQSGGVNQPSGAWWCGASKTVLMAAWWNGKLIPSMIVQVPNGKGGYNCELTTEYTFCPFFDDKDCDGYSTASGDKQDCNDSNQLIHPGQIETTGDSVDYDCDGWADEPNWKYSVSGIGSGYTVQLVDGKSWVNGDFQTTYPMGLVSGSYVAKVAPDKAPLEYIVRYRLTTSDPWLWSTSKNGSTCTIHIPHQVTEEGKNSTIPFVVDPNYYCHFVKQ